MAGSSDKNVKTANRTGKTDVRIAPEILNRMMSNPEVATKYENMLSKIPALDRWADSMIKSMTGSEVKYRQVWIDKDGNMGSMVITGPSEEQKRLMKIEKSRKRKKMNKNLRNEAKKKKEYEEWLKGKRDEMPVVKTSISESENYMMFDKYI